MCGWGTWSLLGVKVRRPWLGRPLIGSDALQARRSVPAMEGDGMGGNETAVLAGGCAWIMQQLLRHPDGVISTRTGYMGGKNDNPTEEDNIGHAEVVEVIFDPARISYRGLLEVFFQVHRADLDEGIVGSQYRSEIFYSSPEQRRVAEELLGDVDASGHWPGKTVTKISEAVVFWE